MAEQKQQKVETSLMHKGRKTIWHLQQMKNKGEKIVMVGPGNLDPLFSAWAEAAGVDIIRFVAPGENAIERSANLQSHVRQVRKMAPNAHFNIVCETFTVADNKSALETTTKLMADQADSILIMGITNDKLQFLSDNHVPIFGHVGALSGWQTGNIGGYKRIAKTADEAYAKGVEMIMTQFKATLEKLGVTEIPALGLTFDPNLHNAVMHIDDESFGENTVAEVFQTGFQIGDKVIRHAMVKVAN